jgi:transposase-like protein
MAAQLSQQKRLQMFTAYCDNRSIRHVGRTCSVCSATALRYKRMDKWDDRLSGIKQRTEDKVDDSIAEMEARQAKQARAIQAKALQRIIEDGFRSSKDAADAYFKAVQEERVIRGEPSDRLNLVQEQMSNIDDRYEILKELLKDPEFRKWSSRVLGLQAQVRMRREGGG